MTETETDPRLKYLIAGGIGVVAIGAGIWYLKGRSPGPKTNPKGNANETVTPEPSEKVRASN